MSDKQKGPANRNKFRCPICERGFKSPQALGDHVHDTHGDGAEPSAHVSIENAIDIAASSVEGEEAMLYMAAELAGVDIVEVVRNLPDADDANTGGSNATDT